MCACTRVYRLMRGVCMRFNVKPPQPPRTQTRKKNSLKSIPPSLPQNRPSPSRSRPGPGSPPRRRSASGSFSTSSRRRPPCPPRWSWPRSSRRVVEMRVYVRWWVGGCYYPASHRSLFRIRLSIITCTITDGNHAPHETHTQQRADGYLPCAPLQSEQGQEGQGDKPLMALRTVAARLCVSLYNEGGAWVRACEAGEDG